MKSEEPGRAPEVLQRIARIYAEPGGRLGHELSQPLRPRRGNRRVMEPTLDKDHCREQPGVDAVAGRGGEHGGPELLRLHAREAGIDRPNERGVLLRAREVPPGARGHDPEETQPLDRAAGLGERRVPPECLPEPRRCRAPVSAGHRHGPEPERRCG